MQSSPPSLGFGLDKYEYCRLRVTENQAFDKSSQKDPMALKSADGKSKRLVLLE